MPRVTEPAHQRAAGQLRKYLAKYQDIELLLQLGEYKRGTDPDADIAIEKIGPMSKLLQQSADELVPFEQSEDRTEESRGGQACGSTCKFRGDRELLQKNK